MQRTPMRTGDDHVDSSAETAPASRRSSDSTCDHRVAIRVACPTETRAAPSKWRWTTLMLVTTVLVAMQTIGNLCWRFAWMNRELSTPIAAAEAEPEPAPADQERERLRAMCSAERDYGAIHTIRASRADYCQGNQTTYAHFEHEGAKIASSVFTDLVVDFRKAQVARPIADIAHDGADHDPRFTYDSVGVACTCSGTHDQAHRAPRVWKDMLADAPEANYTVCKNDLETPVSDHIQIPGQDYARESVRKSVTRTVATKAIVLARRDDHNPFFQISATLTAWMMMKVLGWKESSTQLVYWDDGLPTPTDTLQRAVLSPQQPVILGRDLMGSVVQFSNVLISPFEISGPMMRHLDDDEPCGRNQLVGDFRALAMDRMNVSSSSKRDPSSCLVTIITRKPYNGRDLQRKWRNEQDVLDAMIEEYTQDGVYKHGTCQFQSVDFVNLTIAEQMDIMVQSDVVIGMHGAGMVNVMWTRPETLVVEIFPKLRKRWGYRNLCQFVGCDWHEFRNGTDIATGKSVNAADKIIPVDEWHAFFDPLMRNVIKRLESTATA